MGSSTSSKKGGVFKGSKNPQVGMASTYDKSTGGKSGGHGGKNPCKPGKKGY